jgi:hypothetical protein
LSGFVIDIGADTDINNETTLFLGRKMSQGYTCHCCGRQHEEIAFSYGTDMPIYMQVMTPRERKKRVKGNPWLYAIDDKEFFIRGNIILPVIDSEEFFAWTVWSSLSHESFCTVLERWELEGREDIVKPMFGYLSTPLPYERDTLNLNMLVHTSPVGEVPHFELEPTDHPLAIEQRKGITMARVHEINKMMGV